MFWQRFEKFEPVLIVLLFLTYLGGTAALALTYDRRFFLNDALAIVVWLLVGLVLLIGTRALRR